MSDEIEESVADGVIPFYEQAAVQVDRIPVGGGIPMGIECVSSPDLGIGGVYGTWGDAYSNENLTEFLEERLGESLPADEKLNLAPLGFVYRHHIPELSQEEHLELEIEVGARLLKAAAQACGWQPQEVDAVLIGMSGPVADDYVAQIADRAGISPQAMVMSVHKACDSSMGALQIALNPDLTENNSQLGRNYARLLEGKKVLVGGIEGLSRFLNRSRDTNALQLFGNGAGVIGVIPGKTMKFLVGKSYEVFDDKGVLAVRMYYPYRGSQSANRSLVEVTEEDPRHVRVAGKMHEPENNESVEMAGPMGMVKLFVRSGVQVVSDVYQAYRERLDELGDSSKSIATVIVHHANYKINKLKAAQLAKGGIELPMPWLVSEFGNVSAASNMIAFLRKLSSMRPGDHILFDGFGAGTYYDVFAVEMGEA